MPWKEKWPPRRPLYHGNSHTHLCAHRQTSNHSTLFLSFPSSHCHTLLGLLPSKGPSSQVRSQHSSAALQGSKIQPRPISMAHRLWPTPTLHAKPCAVPCAHPSTQWAYLPDNSRTTTYKGSPFAGQTTPSFEPSPSLRSTSLGSTCHF